jgi:polygalacturonase
MKRRIFLKTLGQGILATPLLTTLASAESAPTQAAKPAPPAKPAASTKTKPAHPAAATPPPAPPPDILLNVREFGARGDGTTKDTAAIQQAIDRCSALGGGEVRFPAGNFLTGAIALRSNTLLRLDKDTIITGTPDLDDYPVHQVRWEGKWIAGHTALFYAIDAFGIGIVGTGKIVGNPNLGGRPTPESPLRHPALIETINCNTIRLQGFSTSYHLMWSIHPTTSQNIFIKDLTIRSTGGNGDGIDIDSCQHVRIDGCDIATGDDCISLKSGRGAEGFAQHNTTEDVFISNCTFADSIFACIGIGSETSGGIRNVRIENCKFTAAKTFAIYIKSRPGRGAFLEDISCDHLDISGTTGGFLRLNLLSSGIQDPDPVPGEEGIPTAKNFRFTNIHVDHVPVLVDATSIHPHKPLDGLTLADITGTCDKGIALANVKDATLRNINVTGYSGPLLSIANVTGTGLKSAVTIPGPAAPPPISVPVLPYQLH